MGWRLGMTWREAAARLPALPELAGFADGVRALMRQDPEVIMVGEIRDAETAAAAFQAALTGHLLITTFHAGSFGEAVSRLLDMQIEPYLLRSGLLAVSSGDPKRFHPGMGTLFLERIGELITQTLQARLLASGWRRLSDPPSARGR